MKTHPGAEHRVTEAAIRLSSADQKSIGGLAVQLKFGQMDPPRHVEFETDLVKERGNHGNSGQQRRSEVGTSNEISTWPPVPINCATTGSARAVAENDEDMPAILKPTHHEAPYSVRSLCRQLDVRLLRRRETEFVVHFGLCLFVRAWFGLWFSPRRLAFRTGRGSVGIGSSTTLVDRS